jgi:hypothetical protein
MNTPDDGNAGTGIGIPLADEMTIAYYEELLYNRFGVGLCWTVVESIHESLSLEAVAERLDGAPGEIEEMSADEELDALYAVQHAKDQGQRAYSRCAVEMAIIEWRTGVRCDEEWWRTALPTIRLSGTPVQGRVHRSTHSDPELESALWLASPEALQAFTRELIEILVDVGELDDEPEITSARELLAQGVPSRDQRYMQLQQMAHRMDEEYRDAPLTVPVRSNRSWRRMQAARAVYHALGPPSRSPLPMSSVHMTWQILGDEWPPARTRLRRHLRRPRQ